MIKCDVKNFNSLEAFEFLQNNSEESYLIDVRTEEEWEKIGRPNLDILGKKVIFLSWREGMFMSLNGNFGDKLAEIIPNQDAYLFFICRSGVRSHEAAFYMIDYGYKNCYNIVDGFEGKNNMSFSSGWKNLELPYNK